MTTKLATASQTIDQLIISSPFEEPKEHWSFDHQNQTFFRKPSRRTAGYIIASQSGNPLNDPGRFVEIPLVNLIRPRVAKWRSEDYPGVTGITRRLLQHWQNPEDFEQRRFFFCQLEAVETLIWLTEADPSAKVGIDIPSDGGGFERLCSKMATGTGKTIVMAMVIAWQILNKVSYPKDARFSKNVLVMAPGITVRERLGVLTPESGEDYYSKFNIVPNALRPLLRRGKVIVRNWQSLTWESADQIAKRRSVDKRGPISDEGYVREALGDLATHRDLLVLNDEAHHAWRVPAESKIKGVRKEDIEEATLWIAALDRIHKARGILRCFDFSATPFAPSGNRVAEEALFGWIVSDFGLNDAIEAGLVKTPRIVVRDNGKLNAKNFQSKLYHIYDDEEVKIDLNRPATAEEPLPALVKNAYLLLGYDWLETKKHWAASGMKVPPVMISVVNRTETAARIKHSFDRNKIKIEELCVPEKTLQIDSSVLKRLEEESGEAAPGSDANEEPGRKLTKREQAELLRAKVNTVGQPGQPGEQLQNIISVGMLSEGWDAKTVTHIMGLRAFTSQLLCEQVVGRGLRRTSYEIDPKTKLFKAEYVNVFGIPFSFLPVEGGGLTDAKPTPPRIPIYPDPERAAYRVEWPRILRVEHSFRPTLELNLQKVPILKLEVADTIRIAELAPTIEGRPNFDAITTIDLDKLIAGRRLQRVIFETARDVYDQIQPTWKNGGPILLAQVIGLTEKFLRSDRIEINPKEFAKDELRRSVILMLSMTKIVQHLFEHLRFQNTESLIPVFDSDNPIGSTDDADTWYTSRSCERVGKTHMNLCVFDSTWEKAAATEFSRNKSVAAWVKNDHLGFEIFYSYQGVVRKYIPDFLVRLNNGVTLILEVKGQVLDRDKAKWGFLEEWIAAVNEDGRFGTWARAVSADAAGADIAGIIKNLLKESAA